MIVSSGDSTPGCIEDGLAPINLDGMPAPSWPKLPEDAFTGAHEVRGQETVDLGPCWAAGRGGN